MSKRPEIKIALEKFLRTGDAKASAALIRDNRRRAILIPESLVDLEKARAAGRTLYDLGRRIRVRPEDPRKEESVFIIPLELCQISREDPAAVAGQVLPFGTIVNEGGLWLRYAAGYQEVGINDRGDILVQRDPAAAADPSQGPVRNAFNTVFLGRVRRVVTRFEKDEHAGDRQEAEAWLKALPVAGGPKVARVDFKCAGIDCTHIGNIPRMHDSVRFHFSDVRDSEMLRIASLLKLRFRKVRREPPRILVYSIAGLPSDAAAYAALIKSLKASKKNPEKMGLPGRIADSRFYDPVSKGIVPSSFLFAAPLARFPDEIVVVSVNTDTHGEVKSRGVLSSLTSIMALIDIISAHAGAAVLNRNGTASMLTGSTGAGKTTSAAFWAEKNEKFRRRELRRRYEADLRRTPDAGRLGEAGIQKELDRIMGRVGILCQDEWIEILKEGAGNWLFWPTERAMYARASALPGLSFILAENQPLIENAAADFGGSGQPRLLGKVAHVASFERIFYDPDWNHLQYDRSPRMISVNILMERNPEVDFLVRKVTSREAIEWLIRGRTPEGGFEPLCNPYLDFTGVLMQLGVVGDSLIEAYERAKQGDASLLGGGDARTGDAIFEKLDLMVKLWLDNCREIPTYIVNGAAGLEVTQDANWLLSEQPRAFSDWKHVTLAEFQQHMKVQYGVTYGPRGEWTHVPAHLRLS